MAAIGTVPVKAQPPNTVDDGINVFLIFFFRIGVVKAKMATSFVVAGQAEVQAN
jgi:hypothetical protein